MKQALKNRYVIISIVGSHAKESIPDIFLRKQQEIQKTGKSFWLIQSYKAKTLQVQEFCEEAHAKKHDVYCLFIEPAQQGGARPTLHNTIATSFSFDGHSWELFPNSIKVTGKVSKSSTALVFDKLKVLDSSTCLNLEDYFEFQTKKPVRFILGASTTCCVHSRSGNKNTRPRKIVGFGKLSFPYAVWLKK